MNENNTYPRLLRRIQAFFIDGIIIPCALFAAIFVVARFELQGIYIAFLGALIIFILEPLLVSTTGGTIGHHMIGIEVKSKKSGGHINIFLAVIRFVVKVPLGIFSLISVLTSKHHQGIHDLIADSIVILKNPETKPKHERLGVRIQEESEYIYPSVFRRVLMIVLYNIGLVILITIFSYMTISDLCLLDNQCSPIEQVLAIMLNIVWIIGFFSLIFYGWKARLLGCQRKAKPTH